MNPTSRSGRYAGGMAMTVPGVTTSLSLNTSLGGGINGRMPQSIPPHDNADQFAIDRSRVVQVFNTSAISGSKNPKRMIGNFRAVMNAGDILSRQNYSCGGSSQTPQSRPNVKGIGSKLGSVSNGCMASIFWSPDQNDPSVPAAACNVKYVYDSSVYTRFKRDQAILKSYNDLSFSGDNSRAGQSAIKAIRRY